MTPEREPKTCERCKRADNFIADTALNVRFGDVRFDPTSNRQLCNPCWSRVDPTRHGKPSR